MAAGGGDCDGGGVMIITFQVFSNSMIFKLQNSESLIEVNIRCSHFVE